MCVVCDVGIRRGGSGVFAKQIAAQGESSPFPKKVAEGKGAQIVIDVRFV